MKIRIRVWDGDNMWYPGLPHIEGPYDIEYFVDAEGTLYTQEYSSVYGEPPIPTDKMHIAMLSTLKHDKHNAEIWDGDILKGEHGSTGKAVYCKVEWFKNEAWWGAVSIGISGIGSLRELLQSQMGPTYEVVGNIHANPELIS